MIDKAQHVDESGQTCTRHAPISVDALLAYAAVGSRISSFHHDAASKLQSLMMAVDEIGELANEEVRGAVKTAQTALRDLNQLLTINRALAKAPQPKATPLRELMTRAAERFGVKVRGEVPAVDVIVALPSISHALALLLDMTAGPLQQARTVAVESSVADGRVTLTLAATGPLGGGKSANPNELVAVVVYMLRREDGVLSCRPDGFVVALPLA